MKARIACLPGDGIGPEVLREARRVLEVIGGEHNHEFEFVEADIGAMPTTLYPVSMSRKLCEPAAGDGS